MRILVAAKHLRTILSIPVHSFKGSFLSVLTDLKKRGQQCFFFYVIIFVLESSSSCAQTQATFSVPRRP